MPCDYNYVRGKPTVTDESEQSLTIKRKKGEPPLSWADTVIIEQIDRSHALTTGFINETIGSIRQVDFRVNINGAFHSLAQPNATRAFKSD